MNTEYAKCLAWVFDYAAHRIDRAVDFPNGDRYGAVNIIMEIVRTLEGRIVQPEFRQVILSRMADSDCIKRVPRSWRVQCVRPKLQREKDKLLHIADALDAAIAESNQWYADRGMTDNHAPLNNLLWRHLYIACRFSAAASALHSLPELIDADFRLICAAANVFDAATAAASEDFPSVIGLMTGAALLVSGADLPFKLATAEKEVRKQEERQAKALKERHGKTNELKARMLLLATEQHKKKPFTGGHAEVINWLINDNGTSRYFDEAKKLGATPTHSNAAKTLRGWLADTDIPKKDTGTSKKSKTPPSN